MRQYAIGIDIGGTSAKLVLLTRAARVAGSRSVRCEPSEHWRTILEEIAGAAADMGMGRRIAGVGVGCAGCVDFSRGIVRFSPNLPLWRGVPVKAFMEKALRMPCVVDNDVNMMTLAECRLGAARRERNVCCVTIGTGVGGGLQIDGDLYRGGSMSAGELGHVQIVPEGLPCPCGNRGCLERYIGRDGIVRLARRMMGKAARGCGEELSPQMIHLAARAGNPAARAVWEMAGYYLGMAFVGIVNLLNPDMIVVGGGIAKAGNLLLAPARRLVRRRALRIPAKHVRIVRAALGENAGAIGAAVAVFERLKRH